MKLLRAIWFLMDQGMLRYVASFGFYTRQVYVMTQRAGYRNDKVIVMPTSRVVSKMKLTGWSKLVGRHHIIEREIVI